MNTLGEKIEKFGDYLKNHSHEKDNLVIKAYVHGAAHNSCANIVNAFFNAVEDADIEDVQKFYEELIGMPLSEYFHEGDEILHGRYSFSGNTSETDIIENISETDGMKVARLKGHNRKFYYLYAYDKVSALKDM